MLGGQFEITTPQGEDEDAGYFGSAENDAEFRGDASPGSLASRLPQFDQRQAVRGYGQLELAVF